MKYCIPYIRSDASSSRVLDIEKWLGVDELLKVLRMLPPEKEFLVLLDFLVEFAGGLELAKHRMEETLVEQAAVSYKAHSKAVRKIKDRIVELYMSGEAEAQRRSLSC